MRSAPLPGCASLREPGRLIVEPLVRSALLEDLAHGGDLTTDALVAPDRQARAELVARSAGVVAGLRACLLAFELLDPAVRVDVALADGRPIAPGDGIATISGPAAAILTGERTALNLLGRLSGIATATRQLVDLVAPYGAHVVDTRKTTPGLRALEKYAVRCGGGSNHRFGLDDAVLIKDNHLALAGSIADAVARVRASVGHLVKVEIEVDTIEQLRQALETPIDAVLLDNMPPPMLADAVQLVAGRVITEASGGVRPETIVEIARSGVDLISAGWLTHGAPSLDIGLDIVL
ncbi:MAG: carboxylating nicotinate-nucleotide diphosphorylase [Vulcanimicrobiaceae bacterium]